MKGSMINWWMDRCLKEKKWRDLMYEGPKIDWWMWKRRETYGRRDLFYERDSWLIDWCISTWRETDVGINCTKGPHDWLMEGVPEGRRWMDLCRRWVGCGRPVGCPPGPPGADRSDPCCPARSPAPITTTRAGHHGNHLPYQWNHANVMPML